MSNETQIAKDTFQKYSDTFAKLDPNALVPFYHIPVILIDSKNVFSVNSETEILSLLTPMIEGLRNADYARSVLETLSAKLLSDNTALLSGVGKRIKNDDSELGKFGFTYTLRQTEKGWKIIAGIIHDIETALELE